MQECPLVCQLPISHKEISSWPLFLSLSYFAINSSMEPEAMNSPSIVSIDHTLCNFGNRLGHTYDNMNSKNFPVQFHQ